MGNDVLRPGLGGLIGLRVVAENPERFARVVVSNTALPVGDELLSDAFMRWKAINKQMIERGDMPIGQRGNGEPEVERAYAAPFPTPEYEAGPLIMPQRVPVTPDDPAREDQLAAWEVFEKWEKPFLTLFGDSDPITRGQDEPFQERIPGAEGQPHQTIEGAGHMIQESHGEELARLIIDFIESTSEG